MKKVIVLALFLGATLFAGCLVFELIPVAVAAVGSQPLTPADLRIASVDQVSGTSFAVDINNGQSSPVDGDFVFMVTAR